jgi:hypothetical protein
MIALTPGAARGEGSMENYVVAQNIPPQEEYRNMEIPEEGKYVVLPTDTDPRTAGQCVGWITYTTDVNIRGNAVDWKHYINSDVPKIGSIAVVMTGPYWHLGEVVHIDYWKNKQYQVSRNRIGKYIVSIDEYDIHDSIIYGYIDPTLL